MSGRGRVWRRRLEILTEIFVKRDVESKHVKELFNFGPDYVSYLQSIISHCRLYIRHGHRVVIVSLTSYINGSCIRSVWLRKPYERQTD